MIENPYKSPETVEREPGSTPGLPGRGFPWRVFPAVLFWGLGVMVLLINAFLVFKDGVPTRRILIELINSFATSGVLIAAGFCIWKRAWIWLILALIALPVLWIMTTFAIEILVLSAPINKPPCQVGLALDVLGKRQDWQLADYPIVDRTRCRGAHRLRTARPPQPGVFSIGSGDRVVV